MTSASSVFGSHEADVFFWIQLAAARYYRLAEKAGNKTLGNSWYVPSSRSPGGPVRTHALLTPRRIWKEKYDAPGEAGGGKKK